MIKLGIIQTTSYSNDERAKNIVSRLLELLGKKETDVVCLPEQWLRQNVISNFDSEFARFKSIAKNYSLTIIPGAFYEKKSNRYVISAPVIGPTGEIIGKQEKIHPFDYEKRKIKHGTKTVVFKTKCRFGLVICYDMVFADVAKSLVKKGADVLFSPSRIVRRGVQPWHLYVQVRSLENRVPILAANIENRRFGGKSIVTDLYEKDGVMIPKIESAPKGQCFAIGSFNLAKYKKSRNIRYLDAQKFS
ncbi:MAG: carbon-nitrogen hydrolase family protein [Thaumarchaeota archaeon]|nr:carbon-nitrogen hydrolase family protein [Nitrososphaerota archaeon]